MKFEEQEVRNIGTIWKHYRAYFQALKKWIIGRKKRIIYLGLVLFQWNWLHPKSSHCRLSVVWPRDVFCDSARLLSWYCSNRAAAAQLYMSVYISLYLHKNRFVYTSQCIGKDRWCRIESLSETSEVLIDNYTQPLIPVQIFKSNTVSRLQQYYHCTGRSSWYRHYKVELCIHMYIYYSCIKNRSHEQCNEMWDVSEVIFISFHSRSMIQG